ncbi:MAG: threonine--tRNA ligase [Candidatus Heimdallarchaeota archaeon]
MKVLLIHSDQFGYEPKKQAIKQAEPAPGGRFDIDQCLVVFSTVEKGDETNPEGVAKEAAKEVLAVAKQLQEQNIVVYPWVHLSDTPSDPKTALYVLKELEGLLRNESMTVHRGPFGWYKAFRLFCKGHPLSELSRWIKPPREAPERGVSEILPEEEIPDDTGVQLAEEAEATSIFYIMTPGGKITPAEEFDFSSGDFEEFENFVHYELQKKREAEEPPPHVALMQKLELVDYEPGSDPGNFRYYPRGWLVKKLLERDVEARLLKYGGIPVETPIMYDYEHPALTKYLQRFPARQYTVQSGDHKYFLRFSACFGQFLIKADSTLSYRVLPVKMFETASSFRREQRGEIAGLRRLRGFTMPDMHTIAANMDQAKEEFENQFDLSREMMDAYDITYYAAFRVLNSENMPLFDQEKGWIAGMVQKLKYPALIEVFRRSPGYFNLKFEFNVVDNQQKAAALSTVQIDVENARRFGIVYHDRDGLEKFPLLLHTSASGAIERIIYAILEREYKIQLQGGVPEFPLWLSPVQVRLIPVSEDFIEFADHLVAKLEAASIRADVDDRRETVGKRVRAAESLWTPLIVVVGAKEQQSEMLPVRIRRRNTRVTMSLEDLISYVNERTTGWPMLPLPLPKRVSLQPIFSRQV